MAKRNCPTQGEISLYADSESDTDRPLIEYPDLGDLTGILNCLSPDVLDEVTETVFSALSEQDSPVATKDEVLCWQDKLRAATKESTSASAGMDAKQVTVPKYSQVVPETSGHRPAEPPASKRVCLELQQGPQHGDKSNGINAKVKQGLAGQPRMEITGQFALPLPVHGFRAVDRPPQAPIPALTPVNAPAQLSGPVGHANTIMPTLQSDVAPATLAHGPQEDYTMQNMQQ